MKPTFFFLVALVSVVVSMPLVTQASELKGVLCFLPEKSATMNAPAIFISLDEGEKKFAGEVGKSIFSNLDLKVKHSLKLFEERHPPITLTFSFKGQNTGVVAIQKINKVWRVIPVAGNTCADSL